MAKKQTYDELEKRIRILEQEVSENKRIKEKFQKDRVRYQMLFEKTPLGYQSLDENGNFIDVNPAWLKILGYSREEVIGKSFGELLHPDWKDHFKENFRRFKAVGEVLGVEFEMVKKDGSLIMVSFDGKIGKDEYGAFQQTHCILQDITERKRAEEVLRESEERYRIQFEKASDGIFVINHRGKIIDVNESFARIHGYTVEELLELGLTNLDVPETAIHMPERMRRIIDEGEYLEFEVEHYHKDGHVFPLQVLANPITIRGDTYVIAFHRDLTDSKEAEEEKKLLENQLQQSQKMEAIGTLAGGIAHEFNNILGIIIGNTELAIDDVPEWNPAKECLKEIRAASMRAKDVVRHILSFARKTPAQRKPIQISTIIKDSLKLMRASIPTTIEIRQNISCESEMILADPTEINQILMNLCTNSVHALIEETGVIDVSLESISLDKDSAIEYENLNTGDFVKLTVKDTGQGIDPEIMGRVFDPYFTTKDIGKGTGMGLAVAYGIIKKHDGAIKATSELGKGTVFEVLFPLIEETVQPELEEEPEALPTGTERILFVDDEVSLGKMAKQMLERLGYQVITNTNPKEALALFKAEPDQFDLIITDMAMPQMAGDRFAQELMKIRKDIPVILCTGHSARIDEDRAKELSLAAYVMKPLVTRDFANTVRKVLDVAKELTPD